MFYTISKGLLWYLLALLLGFVIGYLIRSAMCNRQVARAKAERSDDAEVERLRGRVANLEPVVSERDRLREELDACRKQADASVGGAAAAGLAGGQLDAPSLGGVDVPDASASLAAPTVGLSEIDTVTVDGGTVDVDGVAVDGVDVDGVDVDGVDVDGVDVGGVDIDGVDVVEVAEVDVDGSAVDVVEVVDGAGVVEVDVVEVDIPDTTSSGVGATADVQGFASPTPDVSGASEVLGRKIKADDLTAVEGIGPAISKLCNGIGIHTWAELAATEPSLLRTMLHDAGPRFQMHDPETWPEQASLLAAGRWDDFKTLTDQLDGGRRI